MESKYKVGDKVRVATDRSKGFNLYGLMDKYMGTVVTISKVLGQMSYKIEEDLGSWSWGDDMFEGKVNDYGLSFNSSIYNVNLKDIEEAINKNLSAYPKKLDN